MERHFILPVSIAAAFHAGLFFGFSKHPAKPTAVDQVITIACDFFRPQLDKELPEVEIRSSEPPAKPTFDPPTPRNPDPVELTKSDWKSVTPQNVIEGMTATTRINPERFSDVTGVPGGIGKIGTIISGDVLDSAPQARSQAAPIYPHEARRDGRSGTVNVEFTVDESGRVIDPRVVSSTDRVFEDATLRAVSNWRFAPGKRDARIVRFRMAVPVVFNLDEGR